MPLAAGVSMPSPAGPLAVELVGVDFAYPGGGLVLAHVDLAVARGEFVAVAGAPASRTWRSARTSESTHR